MISDIKKSITLSFFELKVRNQRTYLGFFWYFLQPLFMFVILFYVKNNILSSNVNEVIAISYEDVDKLKSKEFKELTKGLNLIYIYHNKIDARGDHAPSENEVFNAAQETIEDLEVLIKRLRNQGNFAKIFITADHGFIYKRDKLKEHDKVNLDKFPEKKHKRFILSEKTLKIDGAVSLSMEYLNMDKYVNVPIGADVFKAQGAGLNFVHGGASLEECIVPLLEVKAGKGAKNQRTVELQLISTKKTTSFSIEDLSTGLFIARIYTNEGVIVKNLLKK